MGWKAECFRIVSHGRDTSVGMSELKVNTKTSDKETQLISVLGANGDFRNAVFLAKLKRS